MSVLEFTENVESCDEVFGNDNTNNIINREQYGITDTAKPTATKKNPRGGE